MKKVFRKLFTVLAIGSATTFMMGCEDDAITPITNGSNVNINDIIAARLKSSDSLVATILKSDVSATGASVPNGWDNWTMTDALGYLDNSADVATPEIVAASTQEVVGRITENTTWSKGTVYILKNRVIVTGATLTIEAGTIIKGDSEGKGDQAATLMIANDGKLMAEGTAAEPIVFTSTLDTIQPGQNTMASPNLKITDQGKWGGLVILGKAPISVSSSDGTELIEGVADSETKGFYGGTDATHNSGTIKYVSIRHGGAEIAEGKEINGLTLGGVGSGTTIEFVEVIATSDDGIELFGGTVNVKNALVANQGDDAIDIDQSYSGTIDNFMIIMGIADSDEGLEIDGREGDSKGSFTLKNGTVKSVGTATAYAADFKSKAMGNVENVVFTGFSSDRDSKGLSFRDLKFRFSSESTTGEEKEDAAKNVADKTLTFDKVEFNGNTRVYENK